MITELNQTEFTFMQSLENPIPGRYLHYVSVAECSASAERTEAKGYWIAIKVDYNGIKTTFKTHYKQLAIGWLKR